MHDLSKAVTVNWVGGKAQGWTALQLGMVKALGRAGVPVIERERGKLGLRMAQVMRKTGLARRFVRLGKPRLVTISWASEVPALPDALWCEMVPWIYDCWGQQWDEWAVLLKRHKVRLAFFSARAAAEHFARAVPGLKTHWLPEAMELSLLHPEKPLAERTLHVFEMGRRFAQVHDKIRDPLAQAGKQHAYDPPGKHAGAIPGLDQLYQRMGDAAMIICFPKNMSHPEGAGGVETVTQRYLETIGSGALPVGHCPKELEDLMGFNPCVELSLEDPAGHILSILGDLKSYQPQVDRARAKLQEWGGFDPRAAEMLRVVRGFGGRDEVMR